MEYFENTIRTTCATARDLHCAAHICPLSLNKLLNAHISLRIIKVSVCLSIKYSCLHVYIKYLYFS